MVLVIAPALLLSLGACSGGLSVAEVDACNQINAWDIGGREADRFDRVVAMAQDELENSNNDSLLAAADELAHSAEADRVTKIESFMSVCRDSGWEPPEG